MPLNGARRSRLPGPVWEYRSFVHYRTPCPKRSAGPRFVEWVRRILGIRGPSAFPSLNFNREITARFLARRLRPVQARSELRFLPYLNGFCL